MARRSAAWLVLGALAALGVVALLCAPGRPGPQLLRMDGLDGLGAAGAAQGAQQLLQAPRRWAGEWGRSARAGALLPWLGREDSGDTSHGLAVTRAAGPDATDATDTVLASRMLIAPNPGWRTVLAEVYSGQSGTRVPREFLATSHEWDRIADYGAELIGSWANIFKMLSDSPLLRVGGASQDLMTATPPAASWQAMKRLRDATGCRFLIGLPLYPKDAIAKSKTIMADAKRYLGDSVVGYELGNEPEYWPQGLGGWASGSWQSGFGPYLEWFHKVATAINPCGADKPALLSGPGWGNVNTQDPAWMAKLVERGKDLEKEHHCYLREVNVHYYPYVNNVTVTASELLDQDLLNVGLKKFGEYSRIADVYSLPLRISETNSLYGGGRAGFSETMVGTLWTADALFTFANAGARGFHPHWGKGGAPSGAEGNPNTGVQTNFFFKDGKPVAYPSVHAPWYAYLFWTVASAGGYGRPVDATFVRSELPDRRGCTANIKVWGLRADSGQLRVALLNKDERTSCNVDVYVDSDAYCRESAAIARLLPGPGGMASKAGLTWQGQHYEEGTQYSGQIQDARQLDWAAPWDRKDGRCAFKVALPAASGAVLAINQK